MMTRPPGAASIGSSAVVSSTALTVLTAYVSSQARATSRRSLPCFTAGAPRC